VCCGSTKFQLFADDLKLYSTIDTSNSYRNNLQNSLDKLVRWASDWQLNINIDKCSVLGIHGRSRTHTSTRSYSINGFIISCSNSVRDLGIIIDSGLSYKNHINNCVSKALQRVGVLYRGFLCRDLDFLRKAFITYIRPVVEYNYVIWGQLIKPS